MPWESDDLVPLRALANPLRIRIVSLLTGASMSATEVARELDIAHASASYHLRQLAEAGFLEQVDEQPARGGRGRPRRCYRYDHSSRMRLDRSGSRPLYEAMFVDLARRLERAHGRRTSMDAEVWLDGPVWEEVVGLIDQAVAMVHDKARPPRSDGSVKVSMTALLLEMGDT
ncbi:ArsR/SmtB family transcription factor [Streptosporangium amethystogenes]|uniref:ArsR/SmtB family transcription factor n=1 Tax=Streptosporangium amethystogenes TaxID=2002 RepID=UPI0004C97512|nr:helix-turn-helix domain-containing protein [Streptosporangium amethystogenes]